MIRPARFLVLGALGCAAPSFVWQEGGAARAFDPPRPPADERLGRPRDLDNPAPFAADFEGKADWERRARELREQVLVAMGLWPSPEKTPLRPLVHGKIERDDYTIEKVAFASLPGHYVTGSLYRPKDSVRTGLVAGKRPAVLSPHGHWAKGRFYERTEADARKEIASGAEKTLASARYPLQARCAMLARMGFVVFHYDMVGNADSTKIAHRAGFTDLEAELRLQSFMGLQTHNSVRALDFFAGLPEVDPARIAISGASGGGTQTFMLGAIDDRPALAFPAVMVSTAMQGGCICENASLLRVGTNNIELAALFAPRPLGLTGANDWTRDIEAKGLPELKRIYGFYGAADRVTAKYFPYPHNYNQVSREMFYGFLNKHFALGLPEPIAEKPFDPVPPAELQVWGEERPRPADEADAAGVRQVMTELSDRALDELARNPDEYRRVVGVALRALVVDRLPGPDAVVASNLREFPGDGASIRRATLGRAGAREQIPVVALVPWRWDGAVVVWAHPRGKASLFDAGGRPVPAVARLLEKRVAVVAGDVFLTGEFHPPGKTTPAPWFEQKHHKDLPFAGFFYGYNRSVLANRARDLLTVLGWARFGKAVHLVAFEEAGPWALLARALAGDAVQRAALDLRGFDFEQVTKVDDPMMLPGALKYGGVHGFVPLLSHGETALWRAPAPGPRPRPPAPPGLTAFPGPPRAEDQIAWLLR
jgi:hypothetical protein